MPERWVTVVGVGRSVVEPDTAVLTLEVRVEAARPGEALDECAARVRAVLDAVRPLVPEAAGLQSTGLSVEPIFEREAASRRLAGYLALATIRVRTEGLSAAGRIASTALEAAGEAAGVRSLGLFVRETAPAEATARERAFADALARGEHYARLAGLALGPLVEVSEVAAGGGGPRRTGGRTPVAASSASMPLEGGEFEVTVHLIAQWELAGPDG